MSKTPTAMIAGFTAKERDYIRSELDMYFSTLPSVAEGFQIKTWRGGPHAGKPKIPQAAEGLLDRGIMRLDLTGRLPMLFFTDAGLDALRTLMADARLADPKKFAHVRQELGIDPAPGGAAAESSLDRDAIEAAAWIDSGMPDAKVGYGPDAPKLTPDQLQEFAPASYARAPTPAPASRRARK